MQTILPAVMLLVAGCCPAEYERYEPAADTLDSIPAWYHSELHPAARLYLRRRLAHEEGAPTISPTFSSAIDERLYLLAWRDHAARVDDIDRISHAALLYISFKKRSDAGRSWALMLMFAEDPVSPSRKRQWRIGHRLHHPDPVSLRLFDRPPSGCDVASFLTGWQWKPDRFTRRNYTMLEEVIRWKTWRAVVGSEPEEEGT